MKQYILITDERRKQAMEALGINAVDFLEVQGMSMGATPANVLVTPILPPVTPMPPIANPDQLPVEENNDL